MEPLARRPVPPGFSLDSLPFSDHEVGEKFLENQRKIKKLCVPVLPRHPIPHDPQRPRTLKALDAPPRPSLRVFPPLPPTPGLTTGKTSGANRMRASRLRWRAASG
jgi:hypothetical protein